MGRLAFVAIAVGCTFTPGKAPNDPDSGGGSMVFHDSHLTFDSSCEDSDHDGVCDSVDVCPGYDDHQDADHDGVPDGCDDWPCGPKSAAPASTITSDQMDQGNHLTFSLTATMMNGTNLLVVAPSAQITYTTSYSIVDCLCPGCVDQIEIGLVPGTRDNCVYDGNPQGSSTTSCNSPTTGNATHVMTAPSAAGVYDMRFRLGQDYACADHTGWWTNTPPDAADTVATVCVH